MKPSGTPWGQQGPPPQQQAAGSTGGEQPGLTREFRILANTTRPMEGVVVDHGSINDARVTSTHIFCQPGRYSVQFGVNPPPVGTSVSATPGLTNPGMLTTGQGQATGSVRVGQQIETGGTTQQRQQQQQQVIAHGIERARDSFGMLGAALSTGLLLGSGPPVASGFRPTPPPGGSCADPNCAKPCHKKYGGR